MVRPEQKMVTALWYKEQGDNPIAKQTSWFHTFHNWANENTDSEWEDGEMKN